LPPPPARRRRGRRVDSRALPRRLRRARNRGGRGGRPPRRRLAALTRRFLSRLIDEDGHAVADGLRVDEPQRLLVARLSEDPLARPQHDGEHHQPELVYEVVLEQRLHELPASVDVDVTVELLL